MEKRLDALDGIIGPADEGTRIFRREGTDAEIAAWFDALAEQYPEGLVSPGGVSMYAPVSRPGVYYKINAGNLTAFCFHTTKNVRTLFGHQKKLKQRPFVYVPVVECKEWAGELKTRANRKGATPEAAVAWGDPNADFPLIDPKDKGNRKVKYVPYVD
jgi:hypothetical protein